MSPKVATGAARQYCITQFGGPIFELESNPGVVNVVGIAVNPNGDRLALVIVNTGANDVMISFSSSVSTVNGIRLSANGGTYSVEVTEDFTMPTRTIYAVTVIGLSTLYVLELIRVNLEASGGQ